VETLIRSLRGCVLSSWVQRRCAGTRQIDAPNIARRSAAPRSIRRSASLWARFGTSGALTMRGQPSAPTGCSRRAAAAVRRPEAGGRGAVRRPEAGGRGAMNLQACRGGRPCIWVGGIVRKSHPARATRAGSLQAGFVVILTRCTQSVRYDKTSLVGNWHTWRSRRGPGGSRQGARWPLGLAPLRRAPR
jgi:hypothetical protein